ncbi:MAG: hypothetical protein LBC47_10480 [Tannerella sp.]|jgi:hypothetical protein|nr:hypothetical protein [Tannerella sp.]
MDDCTVAYSDIALSTEEVLKEIGYGNTLPDGNVLDLICELLAELKKEVKPRYVCFVSEGECEDRAVRIRGHLLATNATITRLLEHSTLFAVFAATAGREFEQIQQAHKADGDMLVTYMLDVMGTLLAEKTGDYMETKLEAAYPDIPHTKRFSPGYCNWHLTEQRKIFALLGQQPCGITLSDVCLMTPIKSISGIIGLGRDVRPGQYACQYCELEFCYKRKK